MFVTQVVDTQTNIRYTIPGDGSPLGEGATAKVWKGLAERNPSQPAVAVKIAHRGTQAALLEAFWSELQILNLLASTDAGDNVPWAHKGHSPDDPASAIIIMELVPDAWQLVRRAQAEGGRLSEKTALASGLQYARLLAALHAQGWTTRGDRKAADLRWDAGCERLVVLDWNRCGAFPSEDALVAREELVRQDLRGFGQLWAEFTLGRRVTALPDADDERDPSWAPLSRGLRVILSRALGSRASWGYAQAQELASDLAEHLRCWDQPPAETRRQAESLYNAALKAQDPDERARLADRVLTWVDLASRGKGDSSPDSSRLETLLGWAREQIAPVGQESLEAVQRVKRELDLQAYARAAQVAEEARCLLPTPGALRLSRWLLVARVGVRGNELGRDMGATVRALQECALKMEQVSSALLSRAVASPRAAASRESVLQGARAALERAERASSGDLAALLGPFRLEIEIRAWLLQAAHETVPPYHDGADGRAVSAWNSLAATDAFYAQSLRVELVELDRRLAADALQSDLGQLIERRRDNLALAIGEVLANLPSEQGAWPDLAGKLELARGGYRALRALLPEPGENERGQYELTSWLADVNDCMVRGDVPCALARVQAMPVPPILEAQRALVLSRCQCAALAGVRRLINDGSWPDEFRKAQEIIAAVKRSATLPDGAQQEIGHLESQLDEALSHLAGLRRQLAALVGDYTRVLDAPENEAVDQILHQAREDHYEILDRSGLTPDEAAGCSVAALLARRAAARLLAQARALEQQMDQADITLRQSIELLQQAHALQAQMMVTKRLSNP